MFISFIKQEGRRVYGKLKSLKYKPSPIVSGDLEVPLSLKFESQDKWVTDTIEEFAEKDPMTTDTRNRHIRRSHY